MALVNKIRGLKLGIPADEIRTQRIDHEVRSDGKVVIHKWPRGVTLFPVQELEAPGTHGREDIGYGYGCLIVRPTDCSQTAKVGTVIEMRAKIRRKVIHQRLDITYADGYYLTTKVDHLQINRPQEAHNVEASALLIRCWVRESRG